MVKISVGSLGCVESGELATKTEQCISTTDQVNGWGNRG